MLFSPLDTCAEVRACRYNVYRHSSPLATDERGSDAPRIDFFPHRVFRKRCAIIEDNRGLSQGTGINKAACPKPSCAEAAVFRENHLAKKSEIKVRYYTRHPGHDPLLGGTEFKGFRADFSVDGNLTYFWPQPGPSLSPNRNRFCVQDIPSFVSSRRKNVPVSMTLLKPTSSKRGFYRTAVPNKPGWEREEVQRQSAATKGQWDIYFYAPGRRFPLRSRPEIREYCEKTLNVPYNPDEFSWKPTEAPIDTVSPVDTDNEGETQTMTPENDNADSDPECYTGLETKVFHVENFLASPKPPRGVCPIVMRSRISLEADNCPNHGGYGSTLVKDGICRTLIGSHPTIGVSRMYGLLRV
uniref:MBD domain-containing protein n=1 Tax=Strigamia maritima TaxID=126957 RepID=T1J7E1_STRMM